MHDVSVKCPSVHDVRVKCPSVHDVRVKCPQCTWCRTPILQHPDRTWCFSFALAKAWNDSQLGQKRSHSPLNITYSYVAVEYMVTVFDCCCTIFIIFAIGGCYKYLVMWFLFFSKITNFQPIYPKFCFKLFSF